MGRMRELVAVLCAMTVTACDLPGQVDANTESIDQLEDRFTECETNVCPDVADLPIGALEKSVEALAGRLSAAENTVASHGSSIGSNASNIEQNAMDVTANTSEIARNATTLAERLPNTDLVVAVPADYPTLVQALASLDGMRLTAGTRATVTIAPGTYTFSQPVLVDHPDGRFIDILGSGNVTLDFPNGDGLVVTGTGLGLLDGVTITGNPSLASSHTGVHATGGAQVSIGSGVVVSGFSGSGVLATYHATIRANGVSATGNQDGFTALFDGALQASQCSSTSNSGGGFFSLAGGRLTASNSVASGNQFGLIALNDGYLDAAGTTSTGNGYGAFLSNLSLLAADPELVTGNANTANQFWGPLSSNGSVLVDPQ